MERSQRVNPAQCGKLIVIFHAVGLAGLLLPASRPLFRHLVPFHLLFMAVLLFLNHAGSRVKFFYLACTLFVLGYVIEWIGVHTGKLFGEYTYGATLGFKVSGIPLVIGLNWFLLIYVVGCVMTHNRIKSRLLRILSGAAVLVLLDVLIEPVAVKLDYWHWQGGIVPMKNYVCWFLAGAVFLWLFEIFKLEKQNKVPLLFIAVQFLFFGLLWLFL